MGAPLYLAACFPVPVALPGARFSGRTALARFKRKYLSQLRRNQRTHKVTIYLYIYEYIYIYICIYLSIYIYTEGDAMEAVFFRCLGAVFVHQKPSKKTKQQKKQAHHLHLLVRDLGLLFLFCVLLYLSFLVSFGIFGLGMLYLKKKKKTHQVRLLVRDRGVVRTIIKNRIIPNQIL